MPRPGDVAAVEAMGVDAWFERQLNPSGIDDSGLDARLAAFPAMRLPQDELMRRFPDPAVIRRIARGNEAMPTDPTLHAVYADQVAFYTLRQQAKGEVDPAVTPLPEEGRRELRQ